MMVHFIMVERVFDRFFISILAGIPDKLGGSD